MRSITVENYQKQKEYPGVVAVVAQVLARQRFVAPVDVFLGMGLLGTDDLARWRRGAVQYLERVLRCNLSRASAILRILRFHAHDLNLGASISAYTHRNRALRFSKTGARPIEEAYARHFVVIGKKNPFENAGGTSEAGTRVSPAE
ncbi:MAG: hypothetical protein K9N23_01295 [Akkermansiaceae bacterium]|nr:hypothetical protein [Akkermansiaceae bacterium]